MIVGSMYSVAAIVITTTTIMICVNSGLDMFSLFSLKIESYKRISSGQSV